MAQTSKSKSSRLLKNSLRVEHARNLECGDLSPLLLETANAGDFGKQAVRERRQIAALQKGRLSRRSFYQPARSVPTGGTDDNGKKTEGQSHSLFSRSSCAAV